MKYLDGAYLKAAEKLEECPKWSREAVKAFIDAGAFSDENNLELTDRDCKILTLIYRASSVDSKKK